MFSEITCASLVHRLACEAVESPLPTADALVPECTMRAAAEVGVQRGYGRQAQFRIKTRMTNCRLAGLDLTPDALLANCNASAVLLASGGKGHFLLC